MTEATSATPNKEKEATIKLSAAMDKKASGALHAQLEQTVRHGDVAIVKLYRDYHAAFRGKVWLSFGLSDHKAYLQRFFKNTVLSDSMSEQILRTVDQVTGQVAAVKDVEEADRESYTDEVMGRALTVLDNNVSRLQELARTKFVGDTRQQLEQNLHTVRVKHEDAKNPKEFRGKVEGAFGFINPNRSTANKAAAEVKQAKLGRIDIRISLESGNFKVFEKTIKGLSAELGAEREFKDMKANDLGDAVMILCSAYATGKSAEKPVTDAPANLTLADRRTVAKNNIHSACTALTGGAMDKKVMAAIEAGFPAYVESHLGGKA